MEIPTETQASAVVPGSKEARHYTAFWPLFIVLTTVLLISGTELLGLLNQRQEIRHAIRQLEEPVQQSKVISGTLARLSRELILLSSSSAEARKIVQDFGIQFSPGEASNPPSKP
ncbi:MAG: hypothetical protein HC904_05470 [Blastochloris sp.]|nr:hypothetical protein [Blastochloris sp.]